MAPRTSASLLLVDDDRYLLESMTGWLREQGFQVETANDVDQATRGVESRCFDVVLSDIHLGDRDGFEVLSYWRQQQPATSVILFTGYGTADTAVERVTGGGV